MKYLLDTCILSELVVRRPNEKVVAWLRQQSPDDLFVSYLTIGELHKGIVKRNGDSRGKMLERWLNDVVLADYSDRLLPVDHAVSMEWGRICGESEREGKPRPAMDSLIAATALANGLTLVTRNVSDMKYTGVQLLNPFD